ncbi:hypothetical protein A8924_0578 [Saccharopolyspora erythraea NRRL 2338]|uniref:Uncharacterized protein n=2 Tax=Saccharopolyspora erythraea TaxID=1836 RepID=A4F669_SACEN|nr:hypothetical protein [Saccharopolyspora erythraea]EQD88113.1 hypothetical protein N599_00960 [Saccharopolyspora erythraea D]PFG93344.1 hypothetical protein A8924_0578 [Saccharopolyspora erythraea NRRL 2338]QRK90183.1 hypothetical protein JQX30_00950 [Saccharopolyspora erythraea]CAL99543.1 hypothetical protein SACE_0191 [Saccharopolyspora erythraea NRRL 2338]
MRKISLVAAAITVATCTAGGIAWSDETPEPVKLMDRWQHAAEQPGNFSITSHDGLQDLKWTRWGQEEAVAHGTLVLNPCEPDCAGAPPQYYPDATLRVDQVREVGDGNYYSRYTVTADGLPPEKADQLANQPANLPEDVAVRY